MANMDRETALKILGTLIICLGGSPIMKPKDNVTTDDALCFTDIFSQPTDYIFEEEGIGNIIIKRKDGNKIIVPFSDIINALEL